jgi:hypothetical protein
MIIQPLVSQNGVIIVSDTNNNTSSVNRQLAKDWIENDWKRRKATETADNIPLDPGLADPDYSLPGTDDQQTQEEESEVIPITDDQRFLIIGLVVAAALFGFIKR